MLARMPIAALLLAACLASRSQGQDEAPRPAPTLAEQAKAIEAEYLAANKACFAAIPDGATRAERDALYARLAPKEADYYRRALDLADTAPADPGARDAWLWVVRDGCRNSDSIGLRSLQIAQAISGLLANHSDDPAVARQALGVSNVISRNRDNLTRGLADKATSREARGVACLALGQYLAKKRMFIPYARNNPVQPFPRYQMRDDQGKPTVVEGKVKDFDDEYWDHLRSSDEGAMEAEAEALFDRVIAEFGDVPYNPRAREGDKVVPNPHPRPLKEIAQAQLDDLLKLVVGKYAPDFEGADLDGKPIKLADHKGKVVVLVYWFAGCGPCIRDIPHERELVERFKGKPFMLLGVNADEDLEAARKVVRDHGMTWPSLFDGRGGPLVDRFHVRSFPTVVVIDAKGVLRSKQSQMGDELDKFLEGLVAEAMAARP